MRGWKGEGERGRKEGERGEREREREREREGERGREREREREGGGGGRNQKISRNPGHILTFTVFYGPFVVVSLSRMFLFCPPPPPPPSSFILFSRIFFPVSCCCYFCLFVCVFGGGKGRCFMAFLIEKEGGRGAVIKSLGSERGWGEGGERKGGGRKEGERERGREGGREGEGEGGRGEEREREREREREEREREREREENHKICRNPGHILTFTVLYGPCVVVSSSRMFLFSLFLLLSRFFFPVLSGVPNRGRERRER